MNNEKYFEKIANICGYYNTRQCIKGDCTTRKLCRECEIMKIANPEEYKFYQNLKYSRYKQSLL